MNLIEFILLAAGSLFAIVDPIATVPAFLAMTPTDTPADRVRMARLACVVSAGVLLTFSLVGNLVFKLLGVTIPAFQLAGSIVLLLVALDMLRAKRSEVQETSVETLAGSEKEDIAITPLAIPMLAGPGAITTTILLRNQAQTWHQLIALILIIVLVLVASYWTLRLSATGAKWLSPIALRIGTRIMGLLLAAVAMRFLLDGLTSQANLVLEPVIKALKNGQ